MITLEPHEVCPFGAFCGYRIEFTIDSKKQFCSGLDPTRDNSFVCELWAENYEKGVLKNARDDREVPPSPDGPEKKEG